ncbi:MAG TPA: hypothetical protein PLL23_13680 [Chitinophagaceae bacterium]|nr:hypothetical protein [Chitinophagaceae bacterium]
MSSSNHFSDYYKTITATELLAILNNPGDYQPSAIEAAKAELESRQLSETALQEARQPLVEKVQRKEAERKKIKAVEEKLKIAGTGFFEAINPIQQGIPSTEKMIRRITIVFGVIFLYQLISDFREHIAYIKDFSSYPFLTVLYFFSLVLLPVALLFFWKRKMLGWILLTIYLSFTVVTVLWFMFLTFTRKHSAYGVFENFYQTPPLTVFIIQLLFFVATLYVMCRKNIREVYSITDQKMMATISITALISFFLANAAN